MKEEIKDLVQEIIKHTRPNVKELLHEELTLLEAAGSIAILVEVCLKLEENESK